MDWRSPRYVLEAFLLLVPAALTALFLLFDLRGIQQEAADNSMDWRWWALFLFAVFFMVVIWDISRLLRTIADLSDQRADVEMFYDPKSPMKSGLEHWYRVGIRNLSRTAKAENVRVELVSIDPLPQRISDVILPAELGRMSAIDPNEAVTIAPLTDAYFDVLTDLGNQVRFWTKIRRPRDEGDYAGISTSIAIGKTHRVCISVSTDNPRRRDKNGESRTFIIRQPTGVVGDLEFAEEVEVSSMRS